jgi:hypothetical protein
MRENGTNDNTVVKMSSFRGKRLKEKAAEEKREDWIESSFHIDITHEGEIKTQPLLVGRGHALGMLEIFLAVSAQLLDEHRGRTGTS